jgi:hypothetical protein
LFRFKKRKTVKQNNKENRKKDKEKKMRKAYLGRPSG